MLLDELIKKNSYKLPEETVCGIQCKGYDFDYLKEFLDKPFDGVYTSLMQSTAQDVAGFIPGCFKVLYYDDRIIYLINIDDLNSDLQDLVSIASSKTTLSLYQRLYSFIYDYQETAQNENLKDEELEIINNRIERLYKFLDADPIFIGNAFYIPSSLEDDLIESISASAEKVCVRALEEAGITPEELDDQLKAIPKTIRYGFGLEQNVAGAWIDMYLDRLGEENGIKFS